MMLYLTQNIKPLNKEELWGGADFIVLTNSKNETVEYLIKNQQRFKDIRNSRAIDKHFNFQSRKYERDKYIFESALKRQKDVNIKLNDQYQENIAK